MKRNPLIVTSVTAASLLALAACGDSGSDVAEDGSFTPADRVTMIVPFAAGGGSDLAGRATASGLEEVTGTTITVENIVGGSGAVGYSELLGQEGNGDYLLASETSLMSLPLVQDVEFTYESFTPIMKLGEDFNIVIAAADAPYETCMDVVDAAGAGDVTAAVSGSTGPDNVAWTLIADQFDISFQRVTFESSAEVTAAILGNQIDVAATSPGEVLGQLESGDIKPLCALAPERYDYPELADIPTGGEQGVDATFAQWRGFIAPGGISDEAEQYWIDMGTEFAETDGYTEYIDSNMLQPSVLYGDEFAEYLTGYNDDLAAALGNE